MNNINLILILLILLILFYHYNKDKYIENFISNEKYKKNIFIVTSMLGKKFAERIREEMLKINKNVNIHIKNVRELEKWCLDYNKLPDLVVVRSATPLDTKWIKCLKSLEKKNVKVINPTRILQLTSNKLTSSLHLIKKGVPHPFTKEGRHNDKSTIKTINTMFLDYDNLILKPFTSSAQGKYVQKINKNMTINEIKSKINLIPSSPFVIQEYIDYVALYRIIVINNKALPLTYKDVPNSNKWKVSVCLNPNMTFVSNPSKELLKTGEQVQRAILNGGVHFIDLFETKNPNNKYVVSEINTACSLLMHEKMAREKKHSHSNIAHYIGKYYLSLLN